MKWIKVINIALLTGILLLCSGCVLLDELLYGPPPPDGGPRHEQAPPPHHDRGHRP